MKGEYFAEEKNQFGYAELTRSMPSLNGRESGSYFTEPLDFVGTYERIFLTVLDLRSNCQTCVNQQSRACLKNFIVQI